MFGLCHHTIPFIYQYVENNNPDSLRKSGDPEQNKMLRKLFLRNLIRQKGKKGVVGQAIPYRWEAHHVLPMSFFFRYFTPQEIELILATEYDINDGRNIIFLPKNSHSSPVHNLPYHPSDHPRYTKKVEDLFRELREKLEESKKENLCSKKNVDNRFLEKTLHQHESVMFEYIIGLGCQQLR